MHPAPVTIRHRTAEDLPRLVQVLADQQAGSGYPTRWPLPFPVEQFLVRAGELDAWVAVDGGEVVGHVSVLRPRAGWESDGWAAGTGLAPELLAAVGVLFVDTAVGGRGIGSRLLDTAVTGIRELGMRPVLDVVQENSIAADLYRRRGWRVVGEARPSWLPPDHLPVLLMTLPGVAAPQQQGDCTSRTDPTGASADTGEPGGPAVGATVGSCPQN